MKIKHDGVRVDVAHKECASYACFWPRPDPGVFTQGQGYRSSVVSRGWICGKREISGCPDNPKPKPQP